MVNLCNEKIINTKAFLVIENDQFKKILPVFLLQHGSVQKKDEPYSQKLGSGGETSRSPSSGKIFLISFFR